MQAYYCNLKCQYWQETKENEWIISGLHLIGEVLGINYVAGKNKYEFS